MVALNFKALYALLSSLSFLCIFVSADAIDDIEAQGRPALFAALANSTTCTKENMRIRREWYVPCLPLFFLTRLTQHQRGDLSTGQRLAYIAAVKCLIGSPSQHDPKKYPGAKSRFDDFIIVHMEQTLSIHETGKFLTWHRYFSSAYEHALRTECNYNDTQPYWHWGRWAKSPQTSPLFDGSPTSIGGQGERVPHNSSIGVVGDGGGCIASGPFKGLMINLG